MSHLEQKFHEVLEFLLDLLLIGVVGFLTVDDISLAFTDVGKSHLSNRFFSACQQESISHSKELGHPRSIPLTISASLKKCDKLCAR